MIGTQAFPNSHLQNSRPNNFGMNPNEFKSIYHNASSAPRDQNQAFVSNIHGLSTVQSHASPTKALLKTSQNINQSSTHNFPLANDKNFPPDLKIKEFENQNYEKRINELIEENNKMTDMITLMSKDKEKLSKYFEEKMNVLIDENERLAEIIEKKIDLKAKEPVKVEENYKMKYEQLLKDYLVLKSNQGKINEFNEIHQENEKFKSIIEQQSQRLVEVSKLEFENEKLKEEMRSKEDELKIYKELESNCEMLIVENQKINSEIERLKQSFNDPIFKFGGNQDDSPSKNTNTSRNEEINFLKEVLNQKNRDMDILIHENKQLEITLSKLQKEFEDMDTIKQSKVISPSKKKKTQTTKNPNLQSKLAQSEKTIKKLEDTRKKQEDLLRGYISENEELRDKTTKFESALSKFSEIDVEDFNERIEELSKEVEVLKAELFDKEKEIDSLREIEAKSEAVISANEELNRTIKDLNIEISILREQLVVQPSQETFPDKEKLELLLEDHQKLVKNYEEKCRELEDYWDIDTKVELLINENEGLNRLLAEQRKQMEFWQQKCSSLKRV